MSKYTVRHASTVLQNGHYFMTALETPTDYYAAFNLFPRTILPHAFTTSFLLRQDENLDLTVNLL